MGLYRKFCGLFIVYLVLLLSFGSGVSAVDPGTNSTGGNSTGSNVTVNNTTNDVIIDPYTDLGFHKFTDKKTDFNEIPKGILKWHHVRTDLMPDWNTDINNLKKVMDYNKDLADELYANGTLNYSSHSGGRFQHVPVSVAKDMYYYDCKYDAYETIIVSYLDQIMGRLTPLSTGLNVATSTLAAITGIVVLVTSVATAVAPADDGASLGTTAPLGASAEGTVLAEDAALNAAPQAITKAAVSTGAKWANRFKWTTGVSSLVGAGCSIITGVISSCISSDKGDLMGYWEDYSNYHGDLKLEVPYMNNVKTTPVDPNPEVRNVIINDSVNDSVNNTSDIVNSTVNSTVNVTDNKTNVTQIIDNSTNKTVNDTNNESNVTNVTKYYINDQLTAMPFKPKPITPYVEDVPGLLPLHDWTPVRDWGNWMVWNHKDFAPRNYKIDSKSWRSVHWYNWWNALINAGVAITLGLWWISYTIAYGVSQLAYCFYFLGLNIAALVSTVVSLPAMSVYLYDIISQIT
jgi:hypothetical protein